MIGWLRHESVPLPPQSVPDPRLHALLGLAQGLALYAVWKFSLEHGARLALTQLAVVLPLAWVLLFRSYWGPAARAGLSVAIALVAAGLTWHAVDDSAQRANFPWSFYFAQAVFLHVAGTLVAGLDPRGRAFDYPRLFELGWRNALLVPVAALLTGILWALLWAAAWLLSIIGVQELKALLSARATIFIVTSTTFFTAMALVLRRAEALVTLRRFWLSLNTWFLPLALVLALVLVATVGVVGTERLFATRRAGISLFWFVSLAVLFVNAAYQDGHEPPAYPAWLRTALQWFWRLVPVLALLGAWALALRVREHGWTTDRIWAALVALLVVAYSVGYALSLRRDRWMAALPGTNIAAALATAAALLALLSPLADARRLSVDHQVQRLRTGMVSPEQFDFRNLVRDGGSYGQAALKALADDAALPASTRKLAEAARTGGPEAEREQRRELAAANLPKVAVLPQGASLDPELAKWLTREKADWSETQCFARPEGCAVWIVDLDGRGEKEAVLLWERQAATTATVYAKEAEGWRKQGQLGGALPVSLTEWKAAIETGTIRTAAPVWPDVMVNGKRLGLRP